MAGIQGLENMSQMALRTELAQGGKFVTYPYCISLLVITFRRSSDVYYIHPGESPVAKGLRYTLLSLVLGWWGIPWGPIFTIQALITNLRGGKDVTQQVAAAFNRP